jgi:hypothetical protein
VLKIGQSESGSARRALPRLRSNPSRRDEADPKRAARLRQL